MLKIEKTLKTILSLIILMTKMSETEKATHHHILNHYNIHDWKRFITKGLIISYLRKTFQCDYVVT